MVHCTARKITHVTHVMSRERTRGWPFLSLGAPRRVHRAPIERDRGICQPVAHPLEGIHIFGVILRWTWPSVVPIEQALRDQRLIVVHLQQRPTGVARGHQVPLSQRTVSGAATRPLRRRQFMADEHPVDAEGFPLAARRAVAARDDLVLLRDGDAVRPDYPRVLPAIQTDVQHDDR